MWARSKYLTVVVLVVLTLPVGGCQDYSWLFPGITHFGGSASPDSPDIDPDEGGDTGEGEGEPSTGDEAELGSVTRVVCSGIITVRDLPEAGWTAVYRSVVANGFAGWRASHSVTLGDSQSQLTNVSLGVVADATLLGLPRTTARILSRSSTGSTITLDNGTLWAVGAADRSRVVGWRQGNEVLVVQSSAGSGSWRMVNIDRCEVAGVTSTQ